MSLTQAQRRLRLVSWLGVALVVAFAGCKKEQAAAHAGGPMMMPAVPVTVGQAVRRSVPNQVQAIGNVEPYSTVSVKALVDGELKSVEFREGQIVHAGDLLFTIDPRSFQADLQQQQANLARDTANLHQAQLQLKRYTELNSAGVISKEQYDQFQTNAEALEATVSADRAAVETSRLKLSYCTIRSPITGKTGTLLVHVGNLVKSNDTTLVVINQIQPVYVTFSVPEQQLGDIKAAQARHQLSLLALPGDISGNQPSAAAASPGAASVASQIDVSELSRDAEHGSVTFLDNSVDANTGTIKLKGTFPNPGQRLWPGQFVNVFLTLNTFTNAVVVPSQAVQTGQNGQYVFVVTPDHKALSRPVSTGVSSGGMTVIRSGVQPGETVVTDGQLRLFPGAPVEITSPAKGQTAQTS